MWTEIIISIDEAQADTLSDALMEAGALSVSVEDEWADTEQEQPLYGEPGMEPELHAWEQSRLVVLVEQQTDVAQWLQAVYADLSWDMPLYETREVAEQDWVRLTQSQFEPIQISPKLWIVPTWHEIDEHAMQAGVVNLRLDPGLAFGTGSHPTTRLCLQWLADFMPANPNQTVLDYGCGSGILAIAARQLGAGAVLGTDIDAQAVQSAQDNAQLNHVAAQFVLPDGLPSGQTYDVVVANILSNPLKLLAPALVSYVQSGGYLVLSGILERQTQEMIDAYAPYMNMHLWRAHEGWICLVGQAK